MFGFLLCVLAVVPAQPGESPREMAHRAALSRMHDGRFDAALAALGRSEAASGTAEDRFFRAFVEYWRVLYDPENSALRERFAEALEATIVRAEKEVAERADDPLPYLWLGSAELLHAQLRASERHVLSAAYAAKRARAALDRSMADPRLAADSAFGLGTYQYFADRVPSLLKGIRVLLFLPGGDRDRGLELLSRAARESRYFSLEARLVLAVIYSDRREGQYDAALTEAAAALRDHPEALAVLHGASKLDLDLQRPELALRRLERALERARELGDVDPSVVATLRYLAASSELQRLRPEAALPHLAALLEHPDRLPVDLRPRVDRLAASCAVLAAREGQAPFAGAVARTALSPEEAARLKRAGQALRLGPAAAGSAEDWARHTPPGSAHPVASLAAGRAMLLEERISSAIPYLTRAAESAVSLPQPWRGPALLYLGMAHDLRGARLEAVRWYRLAAEERGYPGREAARMYLGRPLAREEFSALASQSRLTGDETPAPSPRP